MKGGFVRDKQAERHLFQKDVGYYEGNREKLLEEYPEQWVAIYNQKVVGAAPDVQQLLTDLKQRGIPTERLLVRHVTREDEMLILTA